MTWTGFLSPFTVISYETFSLVFMIGFCLAHIIAQQQQLRRQNRKCTSIAEGFSCCCLLLAVAFMSIQCGISFNRIRLQQRGQYDKVMEAWSHGSSGNWIADFEPNVQSPFGPNWRTWFQFTLHIMTIWLLKGCYLGFFFRLANIFPKDLKVYLYTTGGFCLASALASILMVIFWCHPVSQTWSTAMLNPDMPTCSAFTSLPVLTTLTILCIIADIFILILSMLLIKHLKLEPQAHNVSTFIALLLGTLSIISAAARLWFFITIIPHNTYTHSKLYEQHVFGTPDFLLHSITQCQWLQILFRIEVMQGVLAYGFTFGRHWVRVVIVSILALPSHAWRVFYGRLRYGRTDAAEVFILAGRTKRRRRRRSTGSVIEIGEACESGMGRMDMCSDASDEVYTGSTHNPGCNTPAYSNSTRTTLRTAWYGPDGTRYSCPSPIKEKAYLKEGEEEVMGSTPVTPLGGLPDLEVGLGVTRRESVSACDSKSGLLGLGDGIDEDERRGSGRSWELDEELGSCASSGEWRIDEVERTLDGR